MYAFVLRVHQRLDRAAYRQLAKHVPNLERLRLKDILYFEGRRGPDSTRLKKGEGEPPWHFYDSGGSNKLFFEEIEKHYENLVKNLKQGNIERSGFEASWLAHALVDGLTPAHHFPYKHALEDLYGQKIKHRETARSHFIVRGKNRLDTVKRSLKLIGPKGLLTTHTTFEAGAGLIILPLTLSNTKPDPQELKDIKGTNLLKLFEVYALRVESIKMYERFYKSGWTPSLARDVRLKLAPSMVRIVTLAWYSALKDAKLVK